MNRVVVYPMKIALQQIRPHCRLVKRIFVTLGVTAGFLTVTAGQASAASESQRTDPQPELKATMNRNTIKCIVITLGVTAGFLTVTAATGDEASPELAVATSSVNHSEPTLNRN